MKGSHSFTIGPIFPARVCRFFKRDGGMRWTVIHRRRGKRARSSRALAPALWIRRSQVKFAVAQMAFVSLARPRVYYYSISRRLLPFPPFFVPPTPFPLLNHTLSSLAARRPRFKIVDFRGRLGLFPIFPRHRNILSRTAAHWLKTTSHMTCRGSAPAVHWPVPAIYDCR